MAIELIDTSALTRVEIEGTVLHMRTRSRAERMEYVSAIMNLPQTENAGLESLRMIAGDIDSIEGWDGDPFEFVSLIKDDKVISQIQMFIMSGLTEEQEKNSVSSSGSPRRTPAGSPVNPAPETTEVASSETTASN